MSELDIRLVRAFAVIYDEKSVSRAAARLALSQSAVSGLLGRLREVFQDPLFIRSNRGVVPTPKADALVGRMRELLFRFESLTEPDDFDPLNAAGEVRISANDYGQNVLLLPFINFLRAEASGLKIALVPWETDLLSEKLNRGGIDMAISIPQMSPPQLPRQFLFRDNYIGVVRADHPINRSEVTSEAFCSYDHVVVSPMGGSFQSPTDDALGKLGMKRNVVCSVPNFYAAKRLVRMQPLIAVLPSRLLSEAEGDIAAFPLPFEIDGFDAIAVWHQRTSSSQMHSWLRQELARFAAG